MDKYKEAIERLKQWDREHPNSGYSMQERDEFIFPELAESEDEKICGKLIAFLKQCKAVYGDGFKQFGLYIDDALAWLEKQGQQKPAEWSEEDERIKNNLLSELTNLSVRKLIKKETEKKYASWLKNIKDRVQPQPQQEWSEEDEYNQAWIVEMLYGLEDEDKEYEKKCRKMAEWLKSLRPQNTWKPSDEQIFALQGTLPVIKGCGTYQQSLLESLYEDLKKLREEDI